MPELPEVETIVRDLRRHIQGRSVKAVTVLDGRVVRGASPQDFMRRLEGQKIVRVDRRGKAILMQLLPARDVLVVQPMMTGQLIWSTEGLNNKATKLRISLSNGGYLLYNDSRMFGRWQLVRDAHELSYLRRLGPEPLSPAFGPELIIDRLQRHRIPVKALLLDSSFIAGIGNIYASEILFRCGVNPQRQACRLLPQEVRWLCDATVKVLREAVRMRGTSMFTYRDGRGRPGRYKKRLKVYDREGEACLSCGSPIQRIVVRGRSTYFCGRCQR